MDEWSTLFKRAVLLNKGIWALEFNASTRCVYSKFLSFSKTVQMECKSSHDFLRKSQICHGRPWAVASACTFPFSKNSFNDLFTKRDDCANDATDWKRLLRENISRKCQWWDSKSSQKGYVATQRVCQLHLLHMLCCPPFPPMQILITSILVENKRLLHFEPWVPHTTNIRSLRPSSQFRHTSIGRMQYSQTYTFLLIISLKPSNTINLKVRVQLNDVQKHLRPM